MKEVNLFNTDIDTLRSYYHKVLGFDPEKEPFKNVLEYLLTFYL
jgi:catechol-2,3-dioxygenase